MSETGFPMRFYEDIEIGATRESAESWEVTAEEIKAFASEFDPMAFHLDETAGAESPMGGLCASSVHVMSLGVKFSHRMGDGGKPLAILGGLGWDEIRFRAPLLAGDRIRVRSRVESLRESRSRPGIGILTTSTELVKADETVCASWKISVLIAKRPT